MEKSSLAKVKPNTNLTIKGHHESKVNMEYAT
jgi:hypothetical protein